VYHNTVKSFEHGQNAVTQKYLYMKLEYKKVEIIIKTLVDSQESRRIKIKIKTSHIVSRKLYCSIESAKQIVKSLKPACPKLHSCSQPLTYNYSTSVPNLYQFAIQRIKETATLVPHRCCCYLASSQRCRFSANKFHNTSPQLQSDLC
jgi:hypothetical protein